MKREKLFLLTFLVFLVILNINVMATPDIYSAVSMKMDVEVTASFELGKTSEDYFAQYFQLNLSLIPLDTNMQKTENYQISPTPKVRGEDYILFEIEEPKIGKDSARVKAQVTSQNQFEKITEKVDFPIKNVPEEIKKYTTPQEIIDSDSKKINVKASEIVQGETDLLEAINKVAKWIKENIEYTLDSNTEEVSQKASWVLEERYGVCDEITSLFIAMLRSVNIPARYISGVAYTDLGGLNSWGPHAWAEVYVPGYGFIPFDVTYGEFGFVDASHVVLKRSLDSAESSVEYQWKGKGMILENSNVKIDTQVITYSGTLKPLIKLDIKPIKEEIGFGSYNLIEITMTNPNDYYIFTTVYFARNNEMEIEQGMINFELLHPKTTKKMYVVVKISDELDAKYLYTIPFYAQTLRNMSDETSFTAKEGAPIYTREEIYSLKEKIDIPEVMVKNAGVDINCEPSKEDYYEYETVKVNCEFRNTGTIYLHQKSFCFDNQCKKEDLGIGQAIDFDYNLKLTKIGQNELIAVVKDENLIKKEVINVNLMDKPDIVIEKIEVPMTVGFEEEFKIVATIDKKSYSKAYNAKINFWDDGRQISIIEKDEIDKKSIFELQITGKDLASVMSKVEVTVDYEDANGKNYSVKDKREVKLVNLTFMQKILLFMKKIEFYFSE